MGLFTDVFLLVEPLSQRTCHIMYSCSVSWPSEGRGGLGFVGLFSFPPIPHSTPDINEETDNLNSPSTTQQSNKLCLLEAILCKSATIR